MTKRQGVGNAEYQQCGKRQSCRMETHYGVFDPLYDIYQMGLYHVRTSEG